MKTFGTLEYARVPALGKKKHAADKWEWRITCAPHVAIRLKNIFSKIKATQFGTMTLAATKENSRDLDWFMVRYPLEIVNGHAELRQLSDEHVEKEAIVDRMLKGLQPLKEFAAMKVVPRDYQVVAANLWHVVKGLLLADDVGTGKTISGITGISEPHMLPALVVTKTALPKQWKEQIERCTGLTCHILKKGTPYDITKDHNGRFPDVIITGYSKLKGWAETLSGLIRTVIWDEVQELRRFESQKYEAAQFIAREVENVLALSATPIYGYGGEIFNIIDAIRPGSLGLREEFYREWCLPLGNGKYSVTDPVALSTFMTDSGLMLRRTRADVGRELPGIEIVPHYIDADPEALMAMSGTAVELAKTILTKGEAFKGEKMRAAGQFDLEMRQATGIAKVPYVAEFVKQLHKDTGEKIVIFAWHRSVWEVLMHALKDLNPRMYTGSESVKQKETSVHDFIHGDSKALLISNGSGEGLDGLQYVSHIAVSAELSWQAGIMEQNFGRLYRDGQPHPVLAYILLCSVGSDPVMQDVLGLKTQQLSVARNPSEVNLVAELVMDPNHVRKLAQHFLKDQGITLPVEGQEPTP